MTSGDDDWLALVLAGDPVALRLLDLARTLSAEQFVAFVRPASACGTGCRWRRSRCWRKEVEAAG